MGWQGAGTAFDVLPLVFQLKGQAPCLFDLPEDLVLEVALRHPQLPWFADLGLRWHALPVISDMVLQIGGINYPAAPFNGWYMVTEIGTRNLGDSKRYDLLPVIADKMGLNIHARKSLWKDRALTELNEAVLFSFEQQGVTLVDHHTAAQQFQHFVETEKRCGRSVTADWAWIVPPTAASATSVYHQDWDQRILTPNFFYNTPVWNPDAAVQGSDCPYHIRSHPTGPPKS
jgi:nitric-oxide synthase